MSNKSFRPLLEVAFLAVLAFILHSICNLIFDVKTDAFKYSVAELYSAFAVASLFTTLIVIFVRQRSIDSVGSTMMLLTCTKMVPAYMIMTPVLRNQPNLNEKVTFLIIFGVFLIIDTVVAIRLLNAK